MQLFHHVLDRGQLAESQSKNIMWQVVKGIKSMHANGIVHRDISLENTLIHPDGTIRVVDFGQSVRMLNNDDYFWGKAGKAYYRAPEMYEHLPYKGPPCDVFACGVMLFIMLLGTPPWVAAVPSDDRFSYISKYGIESLLVKWEREDWLSESLIDAMTQMLAPKPDVRITIEELLKHQWFDGAKKEPWQPTQNVYHAEISVDFEESDFSDDYTPSSYDSSDVSSSEAES
eukprot:Platyproteum_vivax@DN7138_c0_g1_i3.p1